MEKIWNPEGFPSTVLWNLTQYHHWGIVFLIKGNNNNNKSKNSVSEANCTVLLGENNPCVHISFSTLKHTEHFYERWNSREIKAGNKSRRIEAVKSFRQIQKKAISQVKTPGLICIAHRQSNQVLSRSHHRSREIRADDVLLIWMLVQYKHSQVSIFNLFLLISRKYHC